MLANNGRLKLAIQKDGRITEDSIALLRAAGFALDIRSRALFAPCRNYPMDILSIRDDDIPEYVRDGVSDLGIVGENVVAEKRMRVKIVKRLGFGKCKLALCVPRSGTIRNLAHLNAKRVATSYPSIVRRFFAKENISAEIVAISGSVEIAPALNVADATCDIVSTGSTARVNGLEILHTVMESEAVLIANETSLRSEKKKKEIDQILLRIQSCLSARGQKYVMMNAPASSIPFIKNIIPGMKSPTIMPLADPRMSAVHSVIGEDVFWDVMEKLKHAGATDIVVLAIEKIVS